MKVGASYYPELIDEDEWEQDLATAKEIGLTSLRCGEFAWAALSPAPGEWRVDWLGRFLDLAKRLYFDVVWCTPTATPPPYLFDRWPDLHAVTVDGRRTPVGVRRHYCPSHAGYLDLAAETAERLASDLRGSSAVVGWQVDNELAGDGFTCWCETCGKAFGRWLERRYGTLKNLNAAWQTNVWAQRYTTWSQIPVPANAAPSHAPSLKLAYRRFMSDAWKHFYTRQAQALRRGGAKCVTTNFYDYSWDMPFDRWSWRSEMNAVGISHYVSEEIESRFTLASTRGIAGDRPLWVLEQKAGQQAVQNLYPDDLSRLTSHLTRCKEADAKYAIYWHLRQHSAGCEMEHGAVLRHDGKATRVARAVQLAIRAVESVQPLTPAKDVVLLFSFEQQWANERRPPQGTKWNYRERVEQDWYQGARAVCGEITIGCVTDVHRGVCVLLVPLMQMEEPGLLDSVDRCLAEGGTVLTTADFCRLDQENNVQRQPPLHAFRRWIERVPELDVLHLSEGTRVNGTIDGKPVAGSIFCAVPEGNAVEDREVQTLGECSLHAQAVPFALKFLVGSGRLIVIMTEPDAATVEVLLKSMEVA